MRNMNEDLDLTDSLRRLAATEQREAGPEVEQRLLAAVRARRARRVPRWIYVAAAIVCATIAVQFLVTERHSPSVVYAYEAPGFVALPYAQSGVPLETVVVVRVRMRPAELSSLGVAVPAAAANAQV